MSRLPIRVRSVFGSGLVALALLVVAGSAQAQTAYVADSSDTITPFDSDTLLAAPAIQAASRTAQVAISPDGRTAYVTGYSTGEIIEVDTATNAITGSITGVGGPLAIAISPDGGTLYIADRGGSTILTASTASNVVTGAPIDVGDLVSGLAVSPDGDTVYASLLTLGEVVPVDPATRVVGDPIEVGDGPEFLAITPDGSKFYVPNYESESVSVIDTASAVVIDEIEVGLFPETVAISPDGSRAYVVDNGSSDISVVDTANDEVLGEPIDVLARPFGAAVTADGRRLLVVGSEAEQAQAIDTATLSPVGESIELGGNAEGIAIVPAQTPVPEFSAAAGAMGAATTFDGAASHTYDGRIARYDWDFGDGTSAADAGPAPTHVYAMPGNYKVTLTISNGQGCPGFVFTGETASCGGPSTASISKQVIVGPMASPAEVAVGLKATAGSRSVRVRCPANAKPGGCKFKLQLVSGRPKKLANGKVTKPKPESAVVRLTLPGGKSTLVALRPRPKFAAKVGSQSRVFVKRTRTVRGRTRTDYPPSLSSVK